MSLHVLKTKLNVMFLQLHINQKSRGSFLDVRLE